MNTTEHKCGNCSNWKKYDQNPKSFVGRLWKWHIKFCPGWKNYMASLDDAERNEIKNSMIVLLYASLTILGCNKVENKNGWYYIANNQTKELAGKPFMTTDDIAEASIRKDGAGNKVIMLKLKKRESKSWKMQQKHIKENTWLSYVMTP